jgi:hypothetical protein
MAARLLPPDPPPLTRVDGEAVADVASARRWRTLPGETDWLLKNGTPWLISR